MNSRDLAPPVSQSGVVAAADAGPIQTVFVTSMQNHNWAQPAGETPRQIFGSRYAPQHQQFGNARQPQCRPGLLSSNYLNAGCGIHPSEPNYIWSEAGSNLGVFNDNDPYQVPGGTNETTPNSLSNYLQAAGKIWRLPGGYQRLVHSLL